MSTQDEIGLRFYTRQNGGSVALAHCFLCMPSGRDGSPGEAPTARRCHVSRRWAGKRTRHVWRRGGAARGGLRAPATSSAGDAGACRNVLLTCPACHQLRGLQCCASELARCLFENTVTDSAPCVNLHLRVSTLSAQLERVERLGEEAWAGVAAVDRGEDNASAGLACVLSQRKQPLNKSKE